MYIKFTFISGEEIISRLNNENKQIILYGDFNVLNFLYKTGLQLDESIVLYPDSTAVYFTIKYFYNKKMKKYVSTDIQQQLLQKAIDNEKKIYFFGDHESVLKKMKDMLQVKFPNINICGTISGYGFDSDSVIKQINNTKPDILFIGLGVGRQEKWIIENYQKLNAQIIISVGGWFRFLAGKKRRAPFYLRKFHLEWSYRLLTEFPNVWKRYLIGVPKFYYRIVTGRIKLDIRNLDG